MSMERERNQENSTCLTSSSTIKVESPRKASVGGGTGDHRLKRDEWSEGAVASLLEAYETKWILRNRAKLKGQDWEDVARHVSSRANSTKSPKTQTQCKNKIESMKKRYRSESAAAAAAENTAASSSSWPLYSRLDSLLRGGSNGGPAAGNHPSPLVSPTPIQQHQPPPPQSPRPPCASTSTTAAACGTTAAAACPNNYNKSGSGNQALILMEEKSPPLPAETAQSSHEAHEAAATAGGGLFEEDDGGGGPAKLALTDDHQVSESDRNLMETSTSTPAALYRDKERLNMKKPMEKTRKKKKQKTSRTSIDHNNNNNNNTADSIRWLAEAMVRSEQVRMDGMRELEAMRVEAEVKRGEMDLKRTQIIANTQLDIAKIFAAALAGKGAVDSSLGIGRTSSD